MTLLVLKQHSLVGNKLGLTEEAKSSRDRPIIGYTDYLNRYRLIGIGIPHIGIGNGKNLRAGNRLD